MNEINGFTFYKDYYNLIKILPTKNREKVLWAIMEFMYEDKIPNLDENSQAVFNTLSYQLSVSKKQASNGCRGGRPKKRTSEENPNGNPNGNPNDNPNDNPNGNPKGKQIYISNFLFLIYNFKFNNNINNLLKEYLELRVKNKYTLTNSIVNRLCNKLIQYSKNDKEKEEIILNAINGSWKDFYPLKKSENEKDNRVPEWFNKEVKKSEPDSEKKNKIEEILKEYKK